jgi:hypothetical protein
MTMSGFGVGRLSLVGWCVAGLVVAAGCSGPVAIPASYKTYSAKDQSFAVDYPENWKAVGGGQSGYYSARFTSGSASIRVTADMVGSVIGDIARSQSRMAGTEHIEQFKPINKVHELGNKQMAEEWSSYQEQPAAPFRSGFGEGRLSEFTAGGSFGGKMHGYRLTALSVDRRITVVCYAREADWQKLKPAFDKVNASLKSGR